MKPTIKIPRIVWSKDGKLMFELVEKLRSFEHSSDATHCPVHSVELTHMGGDGLPSCRICGGDGA